ncbi:hypothetical protein TREMEDRAFT_73389 [Tremella mesenterica DSM 1558]|uniref:uncharacterized protein n=1 Tax=Tremella mesenterica (strain ATCC 24925 / CBS 8224 / DSM 1558 / NBRC 9311 / NRRL Y-6157 / RJB 2259-6 / UBC 559-6) TaxID=578456 RepID=UPI0003F48F17|nr:uncharacterized protein TREMEDRAFT_73389 [Tremella mesenterica DSM 1558]EIW71697.1 hypothetical protein TREMEDRAFT_73389 [Tremella mesenterica DSM 1558]
MPYATPTSPSPLPSPVKEQTSSRSRWTYPTIDAGPSTATGPMPLIPRRTSSNASPATTPRRIIPSMSRTPSMGGSTPSTPSASRPVDGLPRRASDEGPSAVPGLPTSVNGDGSLGLRLLPSPAKGISSQRRTKDSMSSTSTLDSSLPATPQDDIRDLPVHIEHIEDHGDSRTKEPRGAHSVPFPTFEPSLKPHHHQHVIGRASPPRPALAARRSSASSHRGSGTGSLQIEFPPHPSETGRSSPRPQEHPVHQHQHSLLRPTSNMIRKKSGEVVKSSLKQRSASTPDLTRQIPSEPPSPDGSVRQFGEERSKSVRFAGGDDAEDGVLENVVVFLREQKVTAINRTPGEPGTGASDRDTDRDTDRETENDLDTDTDFVEFRTRRNEAARAIDEAHSIQLDGGSRVPRLRTDFGPETKELLKGENVILERVELVTGPGPLQLRGTALVRNVAFQKWVAVRFTMDHWQTTSEVSCTHVTHIPSATTYDEGWDRFSFVIKLEDYRRKLDERQLILCVRFSVDGEEWWDSNDGMNYSFTFKKAPRRPIRHSGPAGMAGGFLRLNDPAHTTLPGLKVHHHRPVAHSDPSGPKHWLFPKHGKHPGEEPIPRTDSPLPTPPPPVAFKAPSVPDVHTHLSLSKYCAPSPPQSPPREINLPSLVASPAELISSPMTIIGGQPATRASPLQHERRSSWNGKSASWDSFANALESEENGPPDDISSCSSTDGEATPVASGSRSPTGELADSGESSPDRPMLSMKRSTNNLQALVSDDAGLMTPPSSNLSSPPTPPRPKLPLLPSPSSSTVSTGESSPIHTISSDSSSADFASFASRMQAGKMKAKQFGSDSYQEFLDRFCFFQPPSMATPDNTSHFPPKGNNTPGQASPQGFPFLSQTNSPANTPTPKFEKSSAGIANSPPLPAQSTPRPSPQLVPRVLRIPFQAPNPPAQTRA